MWAILQVEDDGDGLIAIWVHLGEPSYKVRSSRRGVARISLRGGSWPVLGPAYLGGAP